MILYGEQRTPEWFEARLGIATASKFAAVMAKGRGDSGEAVTRRNYRWHLALEQLTGRPQDDGPKKTFDMQRGIDLEEEGLTAFEIATGLIVDQVLFVRHDSMACGCSPDGLIGDDAGVELKCPAAPAHGEYLYLGNKPPADYKWQVYGSMLVTGRSHWWFCSYNPDFPEPLRLRAIRVERDEAQISELKKGLEEFQRDVAATVDQMRLLMQERR